MCIYIYIYIFRSEHKRWFWDLRPSNRCFCELKLWELAVRRGRTSQNKGAPESGERLWTNWACALRIRPVLVLRILIVEGKGGLDRSRLLLLRGEFSSDKCKSWICWTRDSWLSIFLLRRLAVLRNLVSARQLCSFISASAASFHRSQQQVLLRGVKKNTGFALFLRPKGDPHRVACCPRKHYVCWLLNMFGYCCWFMRMLDYCWWCCCDPLTIRSGSRRTLDLALGKDRGAARGGLGFGVWF